MVGVQIFGGKAQPAVRGQGRAQPFELCGPRAGAPSPDNGAPATRLATSNSLAGRNVAADRDIDRLYSLPLSEFTSARNALVRELRKAGRKEEAAEVQALKKPSATAWAVNQLARREPDKVAELIRAGDALRKAQRDVLGGKGADVRQASRVQHDLADDLVDDARALLEEAGTRATQAAAQRISSTLRAASTDQAAAKLLRKGRLTGDVESIGFGPLLHVAPKGRRAPAKKPPRKPKAESRKVTAAKARLREEREALADAEREAKAARRAVERAERAAERAAARVEEAERRLASASRSR
jgi:hypothetical protein